ncbi:50S ribosomal protein L4 [Luteitalea pratensis]|uniref:Large ribosomal subunit protein uL4 n=1 Tax=Luteitalea pratensis TaxID=1855912 RepID=A0A143PSB2_LUTPR|nr:50S ribosomal protein L4 [Luteitalea pratensis]AMY11627.1 50S ribosomal protein L4 [Luteitalea pratensis]
MQLDVVNTSNQKVGALDLRDEVFGNRVRTDLIWEAVRHEQAEARRGTHATKTRGEVAGSGRKLWKQKGTGRARVSDVRNPIWRKGGTTLGPQPRDYGYAFPKKMALGALRDALAAKIRDGQVVVVDALAVTEAKTRAAAQLLKDLGHTRKTLVIDVAPADALVLSTRNLPGVKLVPANRVTARDVMDCARVIASQAALTRLQETLG